MLEAINFFQTIFMFKNFMPVRLNKAAVKLAIALKDEALQLAAIAGEEMNNGRTTRNLSQDATEADKRRVFAEIAVWHYKRAAEKYAMSADRFEEAGRIYRKKIRAFNAQSQEMRRRAVEAETVVISLTEFLNQN